MQDEIEPPDNVKIIYIEGFEKKDKTPKSRVHYNSWNINHSIEEQLSVIEMLYKKDLTEIPNKNTYISELKHKISSYRQQDRLKNKLNPEKFVSLEDVLELLYDCKLKCHYCNEYMYIIYEIVRQNKQWSLDRVDNTQGHNKGNLVISCLECNLKRRRTNKDAFLFTKNMKIQREGIDYTV
jgi:hypothetical protein